MKDQAEIVRIFGDQGMTTDASARAYYDLIRTLRSEQRSMFAYELDQMLESSGVAAEAWAIAIDRYFRKHAEEVIERLPL